MAEGTIDMACTTTIDDLDTLIAQMSPHLGDEEYVFCSLTVTQRRALRAAPLFEFIESEGISVVITRNEADKNGLQGEFLSRMITLRVYSSLQAVGFLAAITSRLAAAGISVQTVSAFHHDYLFVPSGRESDAIRILQHISAGGPNKA
jgi:hypothetical protein